MQKRWNVRVHGGKRQVEEEHRSLLIYEGGKGSQRVVDCLPSYRTGRSVHLKREFPRNEKKKRREKRKKGKGRRRRETRVNSSSINLGFVFRVVNTVASKELNIVRLHRGRGILLFVAVDSWMTASLERRYYTDGGMYSNE